MYKPVFPEPKAFLGKASVLPGIDGRKMSKSYGNEIPFAASPDELRSRVRLMITDPQRVKKSDPGNPDVCTVYSFHKIFNSGQIEELAANCCNANIGCVDCKKCLSEKMVESLSDIHARRIELEGNPSRVKEILVYGAERARKVAADTMAEVRRVMNLS